MFRFTIRDVLWLMVVAGLAVAWLGDRWRVDNWWAQRLRILTTELGAERIAIGKGEDGFYHVFPYPQPPTDYIDLSGRRVTGPPTKDFLK